MATEGQPNPKNVFLDRRNFKWYALIGIALGTVGNQRSLYIDLYRSALNIS